MANNTINLLSPATFTSGFLIGDEVPFPGGSVDSVPTLTQVNGEPVSAALEIQSLLGSVLIPRMTTAQMNLLTACDGMMVYNTDAMPPDFYFHVGGSWVAVTTGTAHGVTSISAGANIVLTPNPIITTGTVALATALTGITSISSAIGNTLTLETGGTAAITIGLTQNVAFAKDIFLNSNNAANGLFSFTAATNNGGVYFDASAGNIHFTGVNPSSVWSVYDSNSLAILQVLNKGTAGPITINNGTLSAYDNISSGSAGTNAGSLTLKSLGGGSVTHSVRSTATTYTLSWPTSLPPFTGYILSSDNAGLLSWVPNPEDVGGSPNTLAYFDGTGTLNFNSHVTVDSTGDIATTGSLQAGSVTIEDNDILSSSSLNFFTGAIQLALTIDTSQNASFSQAVSVTGRLDTFGLINVHNNAGLFLNNAGNTFSTSLLAGAITGNTAYTLPLAYPVSNGYVLSSSTGGAMAWVANPQLGGTANTLAYYNSGGSLASNTNVTVHSGGDITTTSTIQAGNITLTGSTVESSGSLILATNGSTTALTLDASQNATFAQTLTVTGRTDALGLINIHSNAGLYLNNSTNLFFTALLAGAITSSTTYTLPLASPTITGQGLTSTTGGAMSWSNVALNGGNTLGANLTLGTTDAHSLILETNSITALTLDTGQNAAFVANVSAIGSITSGQAFTNGSFIIYSSSGGSVTHAVQSTSSLTSYTLKWPGHVALANFDVLFSDTSGNLTWGPIPAPTGTANKLAYFNGSNNLTANTIGVDSSGNVILPNSSSVFLQSNAYSTAGDGIGMRASDGSFVFKAGGVQWKVIDNSGNTIVGIDNDAGAGITMGNGEIIAGSRIETLVFQADTAFDHNGATFTSASTGSATALPAQPAGYMVFQVGGSNFKVPYYNT